MALAIVAACHLNWSTARAQDASANGLPPRLAQTPQSPYLPGTGLMGGPESPSGPTPEASAPPAPGQPGAAGPQPAPETAPFASNMPSFDPGQSAALGGQTF